MPRRTRRQRFETALVQVVDLDANRSGRCIVAYRGTQFVAPVVAGEVQSDKLPDEVVEAVRAAVDKLPT